jgi:hypothetical protein
LKKQGVTMAVQCRIVTFHMKYKECRIILYVISRKTAPLNTVRYLINLFAIFALRLTSIESRSIPSKYFPIIMHQSLSHWAPYSLITDSAAK